MPQQGDFPTPRSSFVVPVTPPGVDPDAGPFFYLAVQVDWLPFVLGALSQLRMKSTWLTATDADNRLAIDRATLLTNMLAAPGVATPGVDPPPPIWTRYNPMTGDVETSTDMGSTWVPSPASDPRTIVFVGNPMTVDQKCNSAASATRYIARLIGNVADGIGAGATALGISSSLVAWLAPVGQYAVLVLVLVDLAAALIAIGAGVITGAMTSTVYDTLECILYCNMSDDGFLTAAAMSNVLDDIGTQIGGTPEIILDALFSVMGWANITNAGYLQLDTDTCTGCGCTWCYDFDFTAGPETWLSNDGAQLIPPWSTIDRGGNPAYRIVQIHTGTRPAFTVTRFDLTFTYTAGSYNAAQNRYALTWNGGILLASGAALTTGTHTVSWTGTQTGVTDLGAAVVTSRQATPSYSGAATITSIHLEGTGENPFGSSNC